MQFAQVLSALAFLALANSAPLADLVNPRHWVSTANTKACPDYCAGTNNSVLLIQDYVCGDERLGPKRLPTKEPIRALIERYNRFGNLCPGQFLAKWYNTTSKSYNYPEFSGFQLNTGGLPIDGNITFPVGFLMDRFGGENGTYVAPVGTPYSQRGLAPRSLNAPDKAHASLYNYHVYKVLKPFEAMSGPTAAWFEQPGQGVQYSLSTKIINLINGGFIEEIDLSELSRLQ